MLTLTAVLALATGGYLVWREATRLVVSLPRSLGDSPVVVPPPDPSVVNASPVKVAEHSVVKIMSRAPSCQRRIEGTGFVFAPQRVMTNAHVVAGERGPINVFIPADNVHYQATIVLYDPDRDIAVLAVPGLEASALTLNMLPEKGSAAAIPGYPNNDPALSATAARIRSMQVAEGPNIYQAKVIKREIFTIRGSVIPGESGAPLLAPDGTVYGMIFAAALDDPQTGYALSAGEITTDMEAGRTATQAVSSQLCSK